MRNFIEKGEIWEIPAPAGGAKSGDLVLVATIAGVAGHDAAEGDPLRIKLGGVIKLPAATGQAWTLGAKLYWDATAKALTTTVASNALVGFVWAVKATADAVGLVKLTTEV